MELKRRLTTEPVLRRPDFNEPFILYTDWSKTTVAACLSQYDAGAKHDYAVAFASMKLSPAQQNYAASEGECFAVVWAVKLFRPYLQGRPFTIVTDHAALKWLMSTQDFTGKLARWSLKLQEYEFEIEHRPGKTHGNVDGLTRADSDPSEPHSEPKIDMCMLHDTPTGFLCETDEPTYAWSRVARFEVPGSPLLPQPLHEWYPADGSPLMERRQALQPLSSAISITHSECLRIMHDLETLDDDVGGVTAPTPPLPPSPTGDLYTDAQTDLSWGYDLDPDAPMLPPISADFGAYMMDNAAAAPLMRRDNDDPSPAPNQDRLLGLSIAAWVASKVEEITARIYADRKRTRHPPTAMATKALNDGTDADADATALAAASEEAVWLLDAVSAICEAWVKDILDVSSVADNFPPAQPFTHQLAGAVLLPPVQPGTHMLCMSDGCTDAARMLDDRPARRDQPQPRHDTGARTAPLPLNIGGRQEDLHPAQRTSALHHPSATLQRHNMRDPRHHNNANDTMRPTPAQPRDTVHSQPNAPTSESREDARNPPPPATGLNAGRLQTPNTNDNTDSGTTISKYDNIKCMRCNQGDNMDVLVLCDGCDRGCHTYCMKPPIERVPRGKWYCSHCITSGAETTPPQKLPNTAGSPTSQTRTASPNHHEEDGEEVPGLEENNSDEEAANEVMADERVIAHLCGKKIDFPTSWTKQEIRRERRRIRKRALNYKVVEDTLYRRAGVGSPLDRRIPRPRERQEIIAECHNLGHFGVNKTYQTLQTRFYWPRMYDDVKRHVAACEACKTDKLTLVRQQELNPLPIVQVLHRVHMDCMGPYTPTHAGNRYILLAVDSWSKWPEARATPDNRANTLERFLREDIIYRHGVPHEIVTDRGREFLGAFAETCKSNRIQVFKTSSYKPSSNGQAERIVGVLRSALVKMVNEQGDVRDWDMHLPRALFAYRAARQASSRVSPALALYGRELTLPQQLPEPKDPIDMEDSEDNSDASDLRQAQAINQRATLLQNVAATVADNLTSAKDKNKADYKKRKLENTTAAKVPKSIKIELPPKPLHKVVGPSKLASGEATIRPDPSIHGQNPGDALLANDNTAVSTNSSSLDSKGKQDLPKPKRTKARGNGDQPSKELSKEDPLAGLPDLPENALVYMKRKRNHKLSKDVEGPYYFQFYSANGKQACLRDAVGKQWWIAIERLAYDPKQY
jgi:hypothetical protein